MKKILENIKIYLKILIRSKWTWIVFVANVLYFLLVCNANVRHRIVGQLLHASSYSASSVMLFFIVFGFYISKLERKLWFEETIESIPEGKTFKFFAKIIVIILLSLVTSLIGLIIYYIFFYKMNADIYFYKNAIPYLLLYWTFPFAIAGFLGLIIGNFIQSKAAYILLIILWLIISCTSQVVFEFFSNILRVDFNLLGVLLNLIQTDPLVRYNTLYGLPLEKIRWIRIAIWTIIIAYSLLMMYVKETKIKKFKAYIISTASFLIFLSLAIVLFVNSSTPVMKNSCKYSVYRYDWEYYQKLKGVSFENKDNFKVKSYDIKLDYKDKLKADVTMDINLIKEPYGEMVFTLYHDFKVKDIVLDDKKLSFNQKEDQVKVTLPNSSNKDIKLKVIYEGNSSPGFYFNNQGAFLLYFFPWIPFDSSYNFITSNSGVRNTAIYYPKGNIKYKLEFSTDKEVFTNLERKGKNTWEGVSNSGINLVSGRLKGEKLPSGRKFYYSDDKVKLQYADEMTEEILDEINNIKKDFDIDEDINIRNIVYIPHNLREFTRTDIVFSKDTLFINNEKNYLNAWNLLKKEVKGLFAREMLYNMLKNDKLNSQDNSLQEFFFDGFQYWYIKKNGINTKSVLLLVRKDFLDIRNKDKGLNDSDKEILKHINDLIEFIDKNQGDKEKVNKFFKDYYNKLSSDEKVKFSDIEGELIK